MPASKGMPTARDDDAVAYAMSLLLPQAKSILCIHSFPESVVGQVCFNCRRTMSVRLAHMVPSDLARHSLDDRCLGVRLSALRRRGRAIGAVTWTGG